jgi:hypothetical protein
LLQFLDILPGCVGDGTLAVEELGLVAVEEVVVALVLDEAPDDDVDVAEVVGGGPVMTLKDSVTLDMTGVDVGAGCHRQY